ncbi:MAG: hypothetical protein ABI743_13300, partial [bacterium]
LISVGWPYWWEAPSRARARETVASLRQIQVALERYGIDSNGRYPAMLYGGDFADDFATTDAERQSAWHGDVDPLLELGYLATYPENPFAHRSLSGARQFEPRDWDLPRDPGRVGWMADGGDRALQLASRKVGGHTGTAMVDLTEGQRHAPPAWAVALRTPDNHFVRAETPWRDVMAGNFVYYACFPSGAGYREIPAARGRTVRPAPMGYFIWAYGPTAWRGQDVCTSYGIPADPWLRSGAAPHGHGPDGDPDGVIGLLAEGFTGDETF